MIEVLGRYSPNDAMDLLLLGILVSWTATIHAARKLPPVTWLTRQGKERFSRLRSPKLDLGVDFRIQPVISRRLPRSVMESTAALAFANLLAGLGLVYWPDGVRESLLPYCYLAYLLLLLLLWMGMTTYGLFLAAIGWMTIHDLFVMSYQGQGQRPQRMENLTYLFILSGVLFCSLSAPAWLPLAMVLLMLCVMAGSLLLASPGLELIWRQKTNRELWSMDGRTYLAFMTLSFVMTTTLLMTLSLGQQIAAGGPSPLNSSMPVTGFAGLIFNWMAVPVMAMVTFLVIRFTWMGIRYHTEREQRRKERLAPGQVRTWEIVQRRILVRGLKRLFKRKARVPSHQGTGVWIALQHWYVLGMSRDKDEDDPEATMIDHILGPPFHALFTPACRFHFWEICRALEVDLILVEDGISAKRFLRVVRVMFETYDMHGGSQRAEELHFVGLPGVQVVLHEFAMNESESLGRKSYPEPDYDEVGRARILHVFKQRGDHEETPEPSPREFDDVPVLSGV
ncbi:MAG: hypothetical protein KDA80_10235 [Planctomycetaceae bacterium]|nr:hypothetical protein [Planctomycetaceae bacterium]